MILYCVLSFISRPHRRADWAGTIQTQSTSEIEIDFYYFCVIVSPGITMINPILEDMYVDGYSIWKTVSLVFEENISNSEKHLLDSKFIFIY